MELSIWESPVSVAEIKQIYGQGLSDGEFKTFVEIGKAAGLNPFLREIWAVKYGSSAAQIFVGRDGYRKNAQAHPDYDSHVVDAVYSNDEFHFDTINCNISHKYNMKDRGRIVGAYCIVFKKSKRPIYVFVDFSEYSTGKSLWQSKPATMIKKVAEAQALRMAFQELFAGTYDEAEQWENKESSKPAQSRVEQIKQRHAQEKVQNETKVYTETIEQKSQGCIEEIVDFVGAEPMFESNGYEMVKHAILASVNMEDLKESADLVRSVDVSDDEKIQLRKLYQEQAVKVGKM